MDADLVIRGGTIFDGVQENSYEGDVAAANGRIVAVGQNLKVRGKEEINAKGRIVTPGFIDIHTHYDGQVTWDQRLWPSSFHGVTTVLMGNCGVGFAPCYRKDRDRLVHLMEGIEDLPEIVLTEGLPWTWTSFPEYLNFLQARTYDMDIATQVPHAALRVHVMGERASDRGIATDEDRARMAQIAREAVEAGALGFATSRTINHRSSDGSVVPTLNAAEAELTEIGKALGEAGKGVMQLISDFDDLEAELGRLRRIAERSRRPLSVSLLLKQNSDKWRNVLAWVEQCNADGLEVRAQVSGRPIGLLMSFEMSRNPFYRTPTFMRLKQLSQTQRLAELRRPDVRSRILSEEQVPDDSPGAGVVRLWSGMYPLGARPTYEFSADGSVAAIAARRGVKPEELAYDLMLEQDGEGTLMFPTSGLVNGTLDAAGEVLRHPNTVYGLGDGGAHLGFLCDASTPTHLMQYWARERRQGTGTLPVGQVVRGLTSECARAIGLNDRGQLRPGYRADINVIDFEKIELGPPKMLRDLPAGGARVLQSAKGYSATIVGGEVTYRDGVATGALPGRLVRGAQPSPS